MANTKSLTRPQRRVAKKKMRKATKEVFAKLPKGDKRKARKFEEGSFKTFLKTLDEEKKKAEEAAKAAAAPAA